MLSPPLRDSSPEALSTNRVFEQRRTGPVSGTFDCGSAPVPLAARAPSPTDAADTGLADTLRDYYRHRTIRNRMREFLGATSRHDATAMYITATGGQWDYVEPAAPFSLANYLDAGLEVDRSLWDSRSLLVDLDIEYTNFDCPAAAWTNPARAFAVQVPVMDVTLRTLQQAGLDPLVLLSGRGFHLIWSVDCESAVFHRLARLGHVNASLAARYAQARSPAGAMITPDLGHAYAGLGMLVEFLGHCVVTEAADTSPVPVEITAIEVGPGLGGREIVSFDLSEYGDPLHVRHVRLPFSAYLKPRQLEWNLGAEGVRSLLPMFEVPLDGMTPQEAIGVVHSPDAAVRLSREVRLSIPDRSGPMEVLLNHYEASALAAFHREFYHEPSAPVSGEICGPIRDAAPCLNWLLEHPNDWLLRPAAVQFVSRILMAQGWHPRAIAQLISGCYEKDLDWGGQWVRLDPVNRAIFYTRLFCGMVVTGVDRLIDFNCVSQREKGYCFLPDCRANILPWRDKLIERRKQH